MAVKDRKISKKDWDKVEAHVQSIYDERKDSEFRKENERKWEEVDRQIAMSPMERISESGKKLPTSWHSTLELGELSKASEIITSDVMRIMFPTEKAWFQPHVYLDWPTDPKTGKPKQDTKIQKIADGLLRSLMVQQHKDFGFKARFRLSVKEALHHGSFVTEVRFENEMMVKDNGGIRVVGAPTWVPYSMWCAYPDPAPSVIGTNMFYTGSMIFIDYMPLWKLKKVAEGDGWMKNRLNKVEEQENKTKTGKTKEIELVKFYGDISIDRADGDIFLPNAKVIMANGTLVYYASNELPYSPVIYSGYERQDVRDPYYTSPIIKQSPMQKFSSIMANHFADATALKVQPPLEYDGNDPDYVMNDGPVIAPGAKTPTKSMGKGMQILDIGDPRFALEALQMGLRHMQEGTGVSALRSGTTNSDRQTAFEVNKVSQGAEIRTIEFLDQLSPAINSFLYMQHELNRMKMKEYEFYNEELHTPDVIRATNKDIQKNACFEIVGSKGLLGEEQRTQQTTQVTAFASQSPLFAPLLKPDEILMNMYRDAGNKNPENYVKVSDGKSPQDAMKEAQMQQMQQALQQLAQENKDLKAGNDVKMAKIESDNKQFIAQHQQDKVEFQQTLAEQKREFEKEFAIKALELKTTLAKDWVEHLSMIQGGGEIGQVVKKLKDMAQAQSDALIKSSEAIEGVSKEVAAIKETQGKKKRKTGKVKAPSGKTYEVDISEE